MTASVTPMTPRSRVVADLVDLALRALPGMRRDDGCFCFERRLGNPRLLGRSPRYTLMVELGLLKAQAAGYEIPFLVDELAVVAWRELETGSLTPGDLGLMLWIDGRRNEDRSDELVYRLDQALVSTGGFSAQLGMELAWIITGLASHEGALASDTGGRLLEQSLDQLLTKNRAPSHLFRHFGARGLRRRFPNFATQIYAVLALAVVASRGADKRALPAARATADVLIDTQLTDGGWPWLFDAERGTVAERYEIYSVHQDAMAPMALLELWETCGDERYLAAVARGLDWVHGGNELGADMMRREEGLVLRSIRRRRGPDRLWLAAHTGASLIGVRTPVSIAWLTEVNPTDRPYHFGWVLEAWCGRTHVFDRILD